MNREISLAPPPESLDLADGEIHVIWASLDPPPVRLTQLAATLSAEELARAARFHFERDRSRFVAGRGLLREILGWLLERSPGELAFSGNAHGKPHLAGPAAGRPLQFNLSHSDSLAAFAVTRGLEVGIDLERIRLVPEADQIAEQFFSRDELSRWRSLPNHRKPGFFFACWTRKEAGLKAAGEGLSGSLKPIRISPASAGQAERLKVKNHLRTSPESFLCSFTPFPGYACSVAANTRDAKILNWSWTRAKVGIRFGAEELEAGQTNFHSWHGQE